MKVGDTVKKKIAKVILIKMRVVLMEDFKLEKIKKYLDDGYDLTFLDEGIDFSTYK